MVFNCDATSPSQWRSSSRSISEKNKTALAVSLTARRSVRVAKCGRFELSR